MASPPHGPDHLWCPWWHKKMSVVCHTCPLWTQVRGTNPNTGEDIDDWQCSLTWLPMMLMENSKQQRQTGAAVESFRNEMVRQNMMLLHMNDAPPMIGNE